MFINKTILYFLKDGFDSKILPTTILVGTGIHHIMIY